MTVILRDLTGDDGDPSVPLRPDGRPYRLRMEFDGGASVLFADHDDELIEALIPGYGAMDEDDRAYRRVRLAQEVATKVQADLLAGVDRSSLSESEWRVLTAPRGVEQPRADWWTCPVPLVVVDIGYQPFTTIPRPASGLAGGQHEGPNLWVIRPTELEGLLASLHEAGFIRILPTEEPPPGQ